MAFCAKVAEAVCSARGTEMAQPLLRQTDRHGALRTAAKLHATWKAPVEVAPSPKYVRATWSLPRSLAARAMPTACGICVPTGELTETKLRLRIEWCTGICRPFTGSW